jgi:peptide/nickel transport system substrate-binding protein
VNPPRRLRVAVTAVLGGLGVALLAGPALAAPAAPVAAPRAGTRGQIVIGAEQEPDCADWIDACAGASWGLWTMQEQTMPRVFDIVQRGGQWVYAPSVLMAAPPTLTTTNGAQVVTYRLNPKAVWSDGTPITSTDFRYTWDQIAHGANIFDRTGYDRIGSVNDTDPHTAVVTFTRTFAGWRQLFGSGYGIFPSHLLAGKDRDAAMKDGYSWSGGPFKIQAWDKGVDVILVPNPNYWGPKPKSSRVTFKFLTDTAAEFQAFQGGEVQAIYPAPQPDAVRAIKAGLTDANSVVNAATGNIEALWINNAAFPFDSVAVRQAVAYAIDRDAIVRLLFGSLGLTTATNSLNPPILAAYSDQRAFAGYRLDLKHVDALMSADGWRKNGGIWQKNGRAARFSIQSTAGDKRRELTEQVLQAQLRRAGFDVTIQNVDSNTLFGQVLPAGTYQMGLYAEVVTDLDPGLCTTFCSGNIPGPANDNSGANWTRTNLATLDPLLEQVDTSTNDATRISASKAADQILAAQQVTLPLDPLPNLAIWSKQISGVQGDNPVYAMFWNLSRWQAP